MFNSKIGIGVLKHPGYNKGKGGGGGGAPTSSTSYSTNVPEYARPYVENMLNAAQAQIYTPDMTGFNPYTPYSSNVNDYIAGFSPMQQQAFSTAANMKVPGQYGAATRGTLGAMAGLGGVEGAMGDVGANYARMATSPYAMSAYMNPYVSAALAPELQLANQQYDIAGQKQQSQAAQQGAFGGTREALMNAQNRQNQMLAQNQLIGQGYNQAFNNAQQAQQFGANLGLQGLQGQLAANQAFLGGANQLAGIGGAQLAAQQGIANLQNQYGQQQQGLEQNKINQAVQDFATAQQYPFMQLGLLNSMLRGLPMQQSSTQMYQAAPNPISQIAGLGAAAYGLSKKDGGVIKAAGGIPMSHFNKEQLDKVQASPYSTPLAKMVANGELGMHNYIQANPEAKSLFAQNMQQLPQTPPTPMQTAMVPQTRSGLDNIGTGEMTQMAGGGLLAFVGGGDTSNDGTYTPPPGFDTRLANIDPMTADPEMLIRQELISERPESEAAKAQREALEKSIANREKQMGKDKWTMLGLNLMAQTGPFAGVNLGNAGKETLKYISEQEDLTDKDRKELLKFAVEQDKNKLTRDDLMRTNLNTAKTQKDLKELQLANLKATQKNTQDYRDEQLLQKYAADFGAKLDAEEKRILAAAKYSGYTPEYIRALAYNNVVSMSPQKMLDLLGKQPIPKDQMPPPKPIKAPEPPGFLDRAGDYLFGDKTAPAAVPAGPKVGDTKVIGGVTYGYDGKGWLPQQ
jgi:hypothetical protein